MNHALLGRILSIFISGTALLLSPQILFAQCHFPTSKDVSTQGHLRVQATTTWCEGEHPYVKGRIRFEATACDTGTWDGTNCKADSTTGNANVNARADKCGPGDGVSQHYYYPYQSATPIFVQSDRITPLDAGACSFPDPCINQCACDAQGPDYYWNGIECVYSPGSPIVIATSKGASYVLTSMEDGVLFDIDGNGMPEQIAWTQPNSDVAFLALDRDGDGRITSGKELFGNHTLPNAPNGFEALLLMTMSTNGGVMRGSVSSADRIFADLLLWTDSNHNGVSEAYELRHASEALAEIGLSYERSKRIDQFGNRFGFKGWASIRTAPGPNIAQTVKEENQRKLPIWDVYFKFD